MPEFQVRPSCRNWNSPGCPAHVNRFYARRVAHFAGCFTCTASTLPHASNYELFPYCTLSKIQQKFDPRMSPRRNRFDSHLSARGGAAETECVCPSRRRGRRRRRAWRRVLYCAARTRTSPWRAAYHQESLMSPVGPALPVPCSAKDYVANQDAPLVSRLENSRRPSSSEITNTPNF